MYTLELNIDVYVLDESTYNYMYHLSCKSVQIAACEAWVRFVLSDA